MRTFTEVESQQFMEAEKGLRDAGLAVDADQEGAEANANLVMQYFQTNPGVPATVETIFKFIEANKKNFVWRTPAQREYDKIAAENPASAQQLAAWMQSQGKAGQLVNSGDQAFENAARLLVELRGRTVDSQRIHEAMGRISYRPGRPLHYVPTPRQVDPRQHRDSEPFLGRDVNMSPADYARQAAERNAQPTQTVQKERDTSAWRSLTEEAMRYGNHANQAELKRLADNLQAQGAEWRQIHAAVTRQVNDFKRRAAVSGTFR